MLSPAKHMPFLPASMCALKYTNFKLVSFKNPISDGKTYISHLYIFIALIFTFISMCQFMCHPKIPSILD